jgi:FemAB-related protein (PEP-CTERM system-associated)
VCADDEATQRALLDRAYRLAREKRVKYLELRNREAIFDSDLQTKRLYVMFECDIDLAEDKLMASFPHEPKTKIRKGIKAGLTSVVGHEHLDDFYSVYAESMHNLGSPIFSKRWCRILVEELGDAVQILIIKNGDRPCASTLAYKYRDWILPTYGGSTVWARKLAASNFMYWEIMRHARAAGIRHFDFGRCKLGTGVYSFKSHWGMREHALPYQYLLPDNAKLPDLSPANKKFQLAIEVWKRLPLGVTKAVGPLLAPFFP